MVASGGEGRGPARRVYYRASQTQQTRRRQAPAVPPRARAWQCTARTPRPSQTRAALRSTGGGRMLARAGSLHRASRALVERPRSADSERGPASDDDGRAAAALGFARVAVAPSAARNATPPASCLAARSIPATRHAGRAARAGTRQWRHSSAAAMLARYHLPDLSRAYTGGVRNARSIRSPPVNGRTAVLYSGRQGASRKPLPLPGTARCAGTGLLVRHIAWTDATCWGRWERALLLVGC